MTKQERLRAFAMRLDGCSWSQIAQAVGYSSTTVHQDLLGCVMTRPRLVNCVYPVIRRIITDQYGGSVSALAAAPGMTQGAMYYTLSGKHEVSQKRKETISAAIGLPPETAFAREEEV